MASLGSVQASVNCLKLPKLSCHVKVAATFSITALSINASQHNLLVVMLSVIMLSVVILSVVGPSLDLVLALDQDIDR
jgi:hypothetical protein